MDIEGKTIQEGEPIPDYPCEIKNEINIAGAIEILNILKSKVTLVKVDDENNSEKEYRLPYLISIEKQAIETVLSELEKKDKVINEMSNFINLMSDELVAETGDNNLEFCKMQKCIDNGELDCEECIKEYFTKKAEKEGIKE